MSDSHRLKGVGIGAGYFSRFQCEAWTRIPEVEISAIYNIITPPETHEEMCAFCAQRGVHIICQKPLAPTFEASRRIVETAATAGSGS